MLYSSRSLFYPDIFQEAGLPLWLRPFEVLVTSSYTALIETIPDTVILSFQVINDIHVEKSWVLCLTALTVSQASIHSIKSRYPNVTSLRDFFNAKYKENSPSFKLAQVFSSRIMVNCCN